MALDWLRRNRERDNWFLHVHFWDPHTPTGRRKALAIPLRRCLWTAGSTRRSWRSTRRRWAPTASTSWGCTPTKSPRATPGCQGAPRTWRGCGGSWTGTTRASSTRTTWWGQLLDLLKGTGPLRGHGHFHHLGPRGEHGRAGHLLGARDGGLPHLPHPLYHEVARLQGGLGGQRPPLQPGFAAHHGPAAGGGALGEVGRPKLCPSMSPRGSPPDGSTWCISQMAHVCQRSARFGGLDLHPHPPRRVPPL